MPSKEDTQKRNKEIQESAKKIISTWPDWKKAYVEQMSPPAELIKRRDSLLEEMELCKNDTRLVPRLRLIVKALNCLADKCRWENNLKVRMMAISERDRLRRLGRLSNGGNLDTIRPISAIPRRIS